MAENTKCPKCSGEMAAGFILDRGHYNGKLRQLWIAGEPEESFWSGIKTSGRAAFYVQALRCENCGFLEFYTTDEVDSSGGFSEIFGS